VWLRLKEDAVGHFRRIFEALRKTSALIVLQAGHLLLGQTILSHDGLLLKLRARFFFREIDTLLLSLGCRLWR